MALPIGTEGTLEEEEISQERIAAGFLVQGSLVVRGEGPFAREEQRAVFVGEEVVEFGAKTKIERRGGGQRMEMDGEEGRAFGLPLDLDQPTVGEFFKHAFERGERDVGKASEVFIAEGTAGFRFGVG